LADPIRLKQVLINTIGNAIKFTDQGSITVCTSIKTLTQPSGKSQTYGIVEIVDTGIGVDPQIQPKLFEAFVMADGSSTRRYGGSGLGLTICRHLLALMNGTIDLTSEGRDCGTVVRLCIPLAPEDSPINP
jgi:signal transduction histidine kinase